MEKYYTTKQVAEMVGLKTTTIRQYVRDGKIKASRIGGVRAIMRISETDLNKFLKELKK